MTEERNHSPSFAYEGRELEAAKNLQNYYRWITEKFQPYLKGDGTEIGAGQGTYATYLRPHFSTLDLVEPSTKQKKLLLESVIGDPSVRVFSETIGSYFSLLGPESRDCICLVNVLEHIEDDEDALRIFNSLLRQSGFLCVFVPAMPILYSKLDKILGHYRRYVLSELVQKIERAGFKVVESRYMDMLGVVAWGLINTLLKFENINGNMAQVYDTVFVPLTRFIEEKINAPCGKSLVVVGQKIALNNIDAKDDKEYTGHTLKR